MKILKIFSIIYLLNTFLHADDSWQTSSKSYESTKYSELQIINKSNINQLKQTWIFNNGFIPKKDKRITNQATPIFTGKYLITTSLNGYLISLVPDTGKEVWRVKLRNPVGKR